MKKIAFAALLSITLLVSACTDAPTTKKVLEQNGYTQVETKGYSFFDCSKDDFYKTKFTALSPNGTPVSGTVCRGFFFKSSTIRYD